MHPLDVRRFGPQDYLACPDCGSRVLGISGLAAHLVVIHDPECWARALARAQAVAGA